MAKTNEVAKNGTFELIPMYAGLDEELKAEIQDELDDFEDAGGIDCRRIKMPTGNSKAFEVESDNPDDPDMMKELRGVILFTHKMNARWEGDYGGENRMPVCSSWDAKQGMAFETGEVINCDTCQYNEFKGNGQGKECKNTRRIYLMLDGKPYLYLLTVPPTSLNTVSKQLKRLITGGTPLTRMFVAFRLESAVSKGGKDYAKITVEKAGDLAKEQGDMARQMREEIKKQYKTVAVDNDDYNVGDGSSAQGQAAAGQQYQTGDAPDDGFMEIPDAIEEGELPFDN